jgi:hypothetical protein
MEDGCISLLRIMVECPTGISTDDLRTQVLLYSDGVTFSTMEIQKVSAVLEYFVV